MVASVCGLLLLSAVVRVSAVGRISASAPSCGGVRIGCDLLIVNAQPLSELRRRGKMRLKLQSQSHLFDYQILKDWRV